MKYILLTLVTTLLMASGQLLFKYGSAGQEFSSLGNIIKIMLSPPIFLALCIYAGTTVLWTYILSKVDISRVYPIQSLAFALVLILSALLFKETIPPNRWIGVAVIFCGVLIATLK